MCTTILLFSYSAVRPQVWNKLSVQCVNSALHPSGVGKSSTSLLDGVKAGRVHLSRVAGNTVLPIWQVMSGSCEMGVPLTAIRSFTFSCRPVHQYRAYTQQTCRSVQFCFLASRRCSRNISGGGGMFYSFQDGGQARAMSRYGICSPSGAGAL